MAASRPPSLVERLRVSLFFSPGGLVRFLTALVTVLVVINLFLQIYHYRVHEVPWLIKDLFDLDEENNIPSWYSASGLLVAAWLLYAIAGGKRQGGDRDYRYWYGLAVGFTIMSMDEAASLHEAVNTVLNNPANKAHAMTWAVPALVMVTILAAIYSRFVTRLPAWFRWRSLLAGVVYVGGAVGVEIFVHQWLKTNDIDSLAYNCISTIEESMEMYSVIFFIHTLLTYMSGGEFAALGTGGVPVTAGAAAGAAAGSATEPATTASAGSA